MTSKSIASMLIVGVFVMVSYAVAAGGSPASAAVALRVEGFASPVDVGEGSAFTVAAVDSIGHVVEKYMGTIVLSSSDQDAVLPGQYTFVRSDGGCHRFPAGSVLFNTGGTQSLTATDVSNPSLTGSQDGIQVVAPYKVLLSEQFNSADSLDPGWSFTTPVPNYNWFNVANGQLVATCAWNWDVYDGWNSIAAWSNTQTFDQVLTITCDIWLPLDYNVKYGYWGQPFYIQLIDANGVPVLQTRFLMDDWFMYGGAPSGWVTASSVWTPICPFMAGWHTATIVYVRGETTWTPIFDGVTYADQPFLNQPGADFQLSALQFINSLREEPTTVLVDNVLVADGLVP